MCLSSWLGLELSCHTVKQHGGRKPCKVQPRALNHAWGFPELKGWLIHCPAKATALLVSFVLQLVLATVPF